MLLEKINQLPFGIRVISMVQIKNAIRAQELSARHPSLWCPQVHTCQGLQRSEHTLISNPGRIRKIGSQPVSCSFLSVLQDRRKMTYTKTCLFREVLTKSCIFLQSLCYILTWASSKARLSVLKFFHLLAVLHSNYLSCLASVFSPIKRQ